MIYKCEDYKGLKIIVRSEYWEKDSKGNNTGKIPGQYIQFHKGIFTTKDKDVIKFMSGYMKMNRNIVEIDEEELFIRKEASIAAERKILARRVAMKKDLAKATDEANQKVLDEQAKVAEVLKGTVEKAQEKAKKIIAEAEAEALKILKGKPKDNK